MRFLVDADLPRSTSRIINNLGFHAEDVRDIGLGIKDDSEIIKHAKQNNFIIVTRDLDFGNISVYPTKFQRKLTILYQNS